MLFGWLKEYQDGDVVNLGLGLPGLPSNFVPAGRAEMQEMVLFNAKSLVIPYLEELKRTELDDRQRSYLVLLERSLTRITQPFLEGLPAKCLTLTPTELLVKNLVNKSA